MYGLAVVGCRFAYTVPSDHDALAIVSAIGPRLSAAMISAGEAPTSSSVPRKPSASPAITRQFSSLDPPGTIASNNAVHIATVTTKMLAMPEPMYCSDQTTNALPPASSMRPTIASVRQSLRLGSGSPSARAMTNSRKPAMKKRSPANKNGGSSVTPTLIARYVEPQKTQTTRYAMSALPRSAAISQAPSGYSPVF